MGHLTRTVFRTVEISKSFTFNATRYYKDSKFYKLFSSNITVQIIFSVNKNIDFNWEDTSFNDMFHALDNSYLTSLSDTKFRSALTLLEVDSSRIKTIEGYSTTNETLAKYILSHISSCVKKDFIAASNNVSVIVSDDVTNQKVSVTETKTK